MATTPYSLAREARKIPKPRATSPEDVRRAEIINRGGAYSDRIKIEPKYVAEPRKDPLPSDTEIKKIVTSPKITT